ncbi:hypothetical protein B0H14DRAFT_3899587 [Mycena olivaceomarginata]|nr:hypothetical protein B0H14DRAFT_3899587 [Mycena olivaceomarginata]
MATGWVLAYADASRKKTTQPMWDRLFAQYWMNFNWRSPVTESIQTAVFINTDDSWVLPIFEPESLTTDEQKEKTKIVQATQKKIKSWFNHKRTSMGLMNPWPKLLKNLRVPNGPAPKRITDHQFYMHHRDFRAKIASEYAEKNFEYTQERESDEVKARIRAEATAEHEQLLEAQPRAFHPSTKRSVSWRETVLRRS